MTKSVRVKKDVSVNVGEEKIRGPIVSAMNIAGTLYRRDEKRFKPVFAFINTSAKQRKPPALILHAVKSLAERESNRRPVTDVAEYLRGTLRKLETEAETKRMRKNPEGVSSLGEILNRAMERAKKA